MGKRKRKSQKRRAGQSKEVKCGKKINMEKKKKVKTFVNHLLYESTRKKG